MINIFVTYRCNLHCPYCFASDLKAEHRQEMSMGDFQRLLAWMEQAKVMMAGFIGGEPTLCPDLPEMIKRTKARGIAVTLFTNGLFPSGLIPELVPYVDNFVVNYNDPGIFPSRELEALLHSNLAWLSDAGARITFSKNFSPRHRDYDYLIRGAKTYGVGAVRYDISRPSGTGGNDHFSGSDTKALMETVLSFVQACEDEGVKTGLDCCMRLCDLDLADRAYLARVSMKFTGICHPSIDIHPDLSASYCLPMAHVRVGDVTEFSSSERLLHHFAEAVRPLRKAPYGAECLSCQFFKTRCQGGCLATKIRESRGAVLPGESATPEEIHG